MFFALQVLNTNKLGLNCCSAVKIYTTSGRLTNDTARASFDMGRTQIQIYKHKYRFTNTNTNIQIYKYCRHTNDTAKATFGEPPTNHLLPDLQVTKANVI